MLGARPAKKLQTSHPCNSRIIIGAPLAAESESAARRAQPPGGGERRSAIHMVIFQRQGSKDPETSHLRANPATSNLLREFVVAE